MTIVKNDLENKQNSFYLFTKRVFDFLSSFFLFVLLVPLFFLIWMGIHISSKGPAFFADKRMGKNGKEFMLLKFRTMFIDSETNPNKYLNEQQMEEWTKERKVKNDPRIFSFGKFLRKSSLDELPQLINIILGQMSVVGPRAITKAELTQNYTPKEQVLFLKAKPGLTGFWQAYARNDAEYKDRKRQIMELSYIKKRSLAFDIKILLHTIPGMIKHKGS